MSVAVILPLEATYHHTYLTNLIHFHHTGSAIALTLLPLIVEIGRPTGFEMHQSVGIEWRLIVGIVPIDLTHRIVEIEWHLNAVIGLPIDFEKRQSVVIVLQLNVVIVSHQIVEIAPIDLKHRIVAILSQQIAETGRPIGYPKEQTAHPNHYHHLP
jgi:hypothetical protein